MIQNERPLEMPGDITVLIAASQKGDLEARDKLYREVVSSLRSIASMRLREEKRNHTLGIDGIVDDAFIELVNLNRMEINDREHFTALASEFMRRILGNYRKWKNALKRGGKEKKLSLHDSVIAAIPYSPELFDLREALERMEKMHPRQKQVLELHYFDGYKQKEVAERLEVGLRTVEKDLMFARTWLSREWDL